MNAHTTLWSYFFHASLPIQGIFIILCCTSIAMWIFILNRFFFLKTINKAYHRFEKEFWSDIKLTELYEELPDTIPPEYLSAIFYAGFTEFCQLKNNGCQTLHVILDGVSRAMRIAKDQAAIHLENHFYWLAIIASSVPYLGLMGTLLGITSALNTLSSLGEVNSFLLLAPGIAEALMISAASLLTALPAFVFYYSYMHRIDRLLHQYHIFQEEFIEILLRQAYEEQHEKLPSD